MKKLTLKLALLSLFTATPAFSLNAASVLNALRSKFTLATATVIASAAILHTIHLEPKTKSTIKSFLPFSQSLLFSPEEAKYNTTFLQFFNKGKEPILTAIAQRKLENSKFFQQQKQREEQTITDLERELHKKENDLPMYLRPLVQQIKSIIGTMQEELKKQTILKDHNLTPFDALVCEVAIQSTEQSVTIRDLIHINPRMAGNSYSDWPTIIQMIKSEYAKGRAVRLSLQERQLSHPIYDNNNISQPKTSLEQLIAGLGFTSCDCTKEESRDGSNKKRVCFEKPTKK